MIPLPAFSWRLAGILAGVAVIALALWWAQGRIRISYQAEQERDAAVANLASYQLAVETAARVAAAQLAADQKADAAMASRLTALQAENEALRRALARIPSTVEKPDANGVPRLAVAGDWWLCVGTFVSRDPADVAACKARSGVAGVPDAVGH